MPIAEDTIQHIAASVANSGGTLVSLLVLSEDGTQVNATLTFHREDADSVLKSMGLAIASPAEAIKPDFSFADLGNILKTIGDAGAAILGTLHLSSGDLGIATVVLIGVQTLGEVFSTIGHAPPTNGDVSAPAPPVETGPAAPEPVAAVAARPKVVPHARPRPKSKPRRR